MWTAIVAIVAMVVVIAIVVYAVRSAVTGPGSPRAAPFVKIESDLAANRLIGLTEAQLLAKYGTATRDEKGNLVFQTGRKMGNPLRGEREPETLVVRLNSTGAVVEAGLNAVPSQRGWGPR